MDACFFDVLERTCKIQNVISYYLVYSYYMSSTFSSNMIKVLSKTPQKSLKKLLVVRCVFGNKIRETGKILCITIMSTTWGHHLLQSHYLPHCDVVLNVLSLRISCLDDNIYAAAECSNNSYPRIYTNKKEVNLIGENRKLLKIH